jgi:hypothetical protein
MKAAQKYVVIVVLLAAAAAAQTSGRSVVVQSVSAVQQGSDVRIEVKLSGPVTPTVDTAVDPDRILLDLPDTTCTANTKSVAVNANGVQRVRTGQHSRAPMITRVVLDLDRAHPYTLKTEGNNVILTIGPAETARRVSRSGAPVAATTGNLTGNLIGALTHRKRDTPPPPIVEDNAADNQMPAPPPATSGPAFEPSANNTSASTLPAPPPAVAQGAPVKVPSETPVPPPAVQPTTAATQPMQSQPAPASSLPAPPPTVAQGQPVRIPATAPAPPAQVERAQVAVAKAPAMSQPPSPIAAATTAASVPAATKAEAPAAAAPVAEPSAANSVPVPAAQPATPNAAPPAEEAAPATETIAEAAPAAEAPGLPAKGEAGTVTSSSAENLVIPRSDDPNLHTVFKVKYVAEGVAYLDGGRGQGLTEGMKLEVKETNLPARQGDSVNSADPRVVAELEVTAVADTSAVTEIHVPKRAIKVGDLAYLSSDDAESLVQQRALSSTRQYPAVISFTEGDTLDEEVREEVPRPPLPSVNRARGRIGLDTIETISHGTSSVTSTDVGVVFRGDITRIGGTYWNLSGYWRGQITKESALAQQTLQETMNRTYHLNLTYDNPNSVIVAGFGRLYLPWAPSLDTIDGGYFGVRLSKAATLGIFGGSTPDPASWDYNPSQAIAGTFINFEGGDYSAFHYSTTTGAALQMIHWASNDPFLFFEENVSYKRIFGIYESAQVDNPKGIYGPTGTLITAAPGAGLGRNFFTFRVNPHPRVELDANYNYFREVPTFDPTLIGTGLLDKYLFQGFSAGARVEVVDQIWLSTQLGRSDRSGDPSASLNQMYGITFGKVPWIRARADVRYSRFNSSFGTGEYESFSLSRQMSERLRLEVLLGQQAFASPITANTRSKFLTGTIETTIGPHYYLQSNFTTNRGDMSYDQVMFSMGYRFDSKRRSQ